MDGNNSDPVSDPRQGLLGELQDGNGRPIEHIEGLRLMRAFTKILRSEDRRMVIELAERLSRQSAH